MRKHKDSSKALKKRLQLNKDGCTDAYQGWIGFSYIKLEQCCVVNGGGSNPLISLYQIH